MSKLEYQVIRSGLKKWTVYKLGGAFKTAGGRGQDYEQIARIVEEDGLFYVEEVVWGEDEVDEWKRLPRGWMTYEGAKMSATQEKLAS